MKNYSYVIHTDGASKGNPGTTGLGVAIYEDLSSGLKLHTSISKRIVDSTNNQAEYEALILALDYLIQFTTKDQGLNVKVYSDSKLMVEQVMGRWKCKEPELQKLLERVHFQVDCFRSFKITHVLRGKNSLADELANVGCTLSIGTEVVTPNEAIKSEENLSKEFDGLISSLRTKVIGLLTAKALLYSKPLIEAEEDNFKKVLGKVNEDEITVYHSEDFSIVVKKNLMS